MCDDTRNGVVYGFFFFTMAVCILIVFYLVGKADMRAEIKDYGCELAMSPYTKGKLP